MSDLPPGFVLGPAPRKQGNDLPPGFVPGPAPPKGPPSIIERMWNTASGMVQAPARIAQGVAEGAVGMGIPKGRASQFEGGPARFAGRALGTGGRNIIESMWDTVKAPGKMVTGEMQPGPEAEAAARGTAMMAAGGGFRPTAMAGPGTSMLRPAPAPVSSAAPVGGATRLATVQMPSGPPRTVQSPPLTPQQMPPGAVGPPPPSALASALATGDPGAVDQVVTRGYRRAILPGQTGVKMSATGIAQEDQRIMTLVDQIIANRKDMTLTRPEGGAMPEGAMPRTRRQFLEAQGQTMEKMYQEYNAMNQAAGVTGVRVPLSDAAAYLRSFADRPEILIDHPEVAADALRRAARMEKIGGYTPEEAQRALKNINGDLQSFYLQKGEQSVAKSGMIAPVADMIREGLNDVIEQTAGPGYAAFRQKFGALRSAQRDLAAAARKDLAQHPDTFSKFADFVASESFLRAIATLSPEKALRGITWNVAKRVSQHLNDPNRAVDQLFRKRMQTLFPSPTMGSSFDPALMAGARAGAIGTGNVMAQPGSLSGLSAIDNSGRRRTSEFDVTPPPGPR